MRKETPEIGWGGFTVIPVGVAGTLMLRYEWRNNAVLILHNLAAEPVEVAFPVAGPDGPARLLVNLLSSDHSDADADGVHRVLLERYGYRWWRLGGLDDLLRRAEV